MQTNNQSFLESEEKLYRVLEAVRKLTQVHADGVDENQVATEVGLPVAEVEPILHHLLLTEKLVSFPDFESGYVITEKGLDRLRSYFRNHNQVAPPPQIFNVTNQASVAGQQFGNQNTLNVTQRGNLVEAATEIQELLKQLEQSYPTETFTQKAVVVDEAVKQIEGDPSFRNRVVGALKSAGKEAFKEAIDHPLVNVFMAAIEGWQEG